MSCIEIKIRGQHLYLYCRHPYLHRNHDFLQVSRDLGSLIQKAADSEMIAKELVRQFQPPSSRRGSCQNGEFQSCQSPPAFGTKSNSGHLLGYYLFEICLALKDFYDLRELLLPPQDRTALLMRPSFRDWFVTVLHVWLKIVLEKVHENCNESDVM